jgi:hypothetical protein
MMGSAHDWMKGHDKIRLASSQGTQFMTYRVETDDALSQKQVTSKVVADEPGRWYHVMRWQERGDAGAGAMLSVYQHDDWTEVNILSEQ